MTSLYAKYITERVGKGIIETDIGFAVFSYPRPEVVYIEDLFVEKEHRTKGVAASMADEIVAISKEKGCKLLLGSIDPLARGAEASRAVLEAYGMKISHIEGPLLMFLKEI